MIAIPVKSESVDAIVVDVPTIRQRRLSVATMNCQTLVLVRVPSSDGVVGCGGHDRFGAAIGEGTTIGGLAYGDCCFSAPSTN